MSRPFLLSATIDFGDDCHHIPYNAELLGQLLDALRSIGVRRLYWNYDGTLEQGFWAISARRSEAVRRTLAAMGDPLPVARRLAHERGLGFVAILKPYECGYSTTSPADGRVGLPRIGGVAAGISPWLLARPELRLKARAADRPTGVADAAVARIQLRQRDDAPLRFGPANVQVWTSPDNRAYARREIAFGMRESIEPCPRDVVDVLGEPVTRRGDPVRVVELTGLALTDAFIAVTTDLDDDTGTFRNTALEMVRAFDAADRPLPIVVASHKATWDIPRDVRGGHLEYDGGLGDANVCLDCTNRRPACPPCRERGRTDCMQDPIYPETPLCRDGVIAFARGRNAYVAGSPCEAYPEVRAYWLDGVGHCIAAGVDAVDVRISNHSCWTDTPDDYGFNEPVAAAYRARYGTDPDLEPYDPERLARLRGELYDEFLRAARRRLAAAGKPLHLHVEVESFRPDAPLARRRTRPGNTTFDWRGWLREGLAAEAQLMGVKHTPEQLLADPFVGEVLEATAAAGVPAHLRHFVWSSRDGAIHADRMERAFRDDRLAGYNYYEGASFYDTRSLGPSGELRFHAGMLEALRERAVGLGLL